MKIIDILNKIANGEEVPKKIKYNNETFTIREEKDDYANQNEWFTDKFCLLDLNEEVEIIEEEKKIPEKLEILNANEHSKKVYYENYSKEEISLDIETLQIWVNKIINYLNSKGE